LLKDHAHARERIAVGLDRPVRPLAGQAELAPGADVLLRAAGRVGLPHEAVVAAGALGAEDPVELTHGELRERIVTVHEDDQPVAAALHVKRAGGHRDFHGPVAECLVEREILRENRFAATHPDIGHAGEQAGHRGGAVECILNRTSGWWWRNPSSQTFMMPMSGTPKFRMTPETFCAGW